MVGAGFGVLDYASGSGRRGRQDLNQVRLIGLGIQAEATLVYRWRFGALTLQPIRATAYLFEHVNTYNNVAATGNGSAFGLSRNGVSLGAAIGLSVDLSAISLAIYDRMRALVGQAATIAAPSPDKS